MDVRQLKYFVGIVDAGSFSKASQKLFVAQPSLSQQIANLEFELDTKLLLRSAQGIMPTAAGSVLYRHARQILRQMDRIRAGGRAEGRRQRSRPGSAWPADDACRHPGPALIRARPQVVSGHSIADRR